MQRLTVQDHLIPDIILGQVTCLDYMYEPDIVEGELTIVARHGTQPDITVNVTEIDEEDLGEWGTATSIHFQYTDNDRNADEDPLPSA